jgi:hypothetical protein
MEVIISRHGRGSSPVIGRWVKGNFETALNWYDLKGEAHRAIKVEMGQRWRAYWQTCIQRAAIAENPCSPNDLMNVVSTPDPYYPCPPELAAKAIWPTVIVPTHLMVEAGK